MTKINENRGVEELDIYKEDENIGAKLIAELEQARAEILNNIKN